MPYSFPGNVPDRIKGLPEAAQKMWIKVYNSAYEQYNDEEKASATAWTAVKKKYTKRNNKWVVLSEPEFEMKYYPPRFRT